MAASLEQSIEQTQSDTSICPIPLVSVAACRGMLPLSLVAQGMEMTLVLAPIMVELLLCLGVPSLRADENSSD